MALSPASSTSSANGSFLGEHVERLIVAPVMEASIALQVARVVRPSGPATKLRVPIVTADPSASWVAELDEITPSGPTLTEAVSDFYKVAGLTRFSNELADDSTEDILGLVGHGLVRDIARRVDEAFFLTGQVSDFDAADSIYGVSHTPVNANGYANLDCFVEASLAAEELGYPIDNWVTDPTTADTILKIKDESGSNRALLDGRDILGKPLLVSPYVTPGTTWGIPKAAVLTSIAKNAEVVVSRERYLEWDAIGIRAVMRLATVYPVAAAIVKISTPGGGNSN